MTQNTIGRITLENICRKCKKSEWQKSETKIRKAKRANDKKYESKMTKEPKNQSIKSE